jgi:hypothetical protein
MMTGGGIAGGLNTLPGSVPAIMRSNKDANRDAVKSDLVTL